MEVRRFGGSGVLFHTDGHRSPTQKCTDFYICLIINILCNICALDLCNICVKLYVAKLPQRHRNLNTLNLHRNAQKFDYQTDIKISVFLCE